MFATTKAIHAHSLEVDMLEVGNTPLRLTVRGALDSTKVDNYCGIGNQVTCDPAVPEAIADDQGLTGEARDTFVRRYYRTRYIYPNLRIDARYALDPMPHRFELYAGYRAAYLVQGDFSEKGPWPGSLYEADFGSGEEGPGERGAGGRHARQPRQRAGPPPAAIGWRAPSAAPPVSSAATGSTSGSTPPCAATCRCSASASCSPIASPSTA